MTLSCSGTAQRNMAELALCQLFFFFLKEDINVYINANNFFHRKIQNDIYVFKILSENKKNLQNLLDIEYKKKLHINISVSS